MRTRHRRSLSRFMIALGIAVPGLIGILVIQAKAAGDAGIYQSANTITPTLTPPATTSPLPPRTSTSAPENSLPMPSGSPSSNLFVYIEPPQGTVPQPYVVLTAFSSSPRNTSVVIKGYVNSQEFICTQSPCVIGLSASSRFVFAAYADSGERSETIIASASVTSLARGFLVTIDSVNQYNVFSNACSAAWGVSDTENVTWDDYVQFPFELHTKKTLHTLATKLLLTGIVDASDCAAGGLSIGLDWPTACGLERAMPMMIEWQNQFDDYIWLASRKQGVPPKILKSLIELETQFWPGNSRFYMDEFGLGQVNQLGVDVLLRKDPTLFQKVCPSVLSDCARSYLSLEPDQQAMIRGAVLQLTDASCADCDYGLDLNKARESVPLIADLLKANCQQVDYILSIADKPDPDADAATATAIADREKKLKKLAAEGKPATATAAVATLSARSSVDTTSYEDLWRFTFLSYHSGMSCFQDAVNATEKAHEPLTWEYLQEQINCKGGQDYVNGLMNNLTVFDSYVYQPNAVSSLVVAPTFVPTQTPVPSPTPYTADSIVRVQVFMDRNGNGSPDEGEWIDAMTVLLQTPTEDQMTARTRNGVAVFDMTGSMTGIEVIVSLPGLYRSERFVLPQHGEVTVTFSFESPALPTVIP